jgi:glycosyltransferase involved in cell wall biosynthesis
MSNKLGSVEAKDAPLPLLARDLEPCLWYPERLVWPNSWVGHIPFAFWITHVLRPQVLVELGVHTGNSYAAFCQAVKLITIPAACFGVDTWQGDEHSGLYGDEVYNELLAWHDPRYGNFSQLIRSTFDEAVEHFSPGTIDLLHIDGLHTYDAVRHDFETWRSRLSNRAVVLFHDTNVRERDFGVWRLWEELSALYPHLEFLHGHGLGVLGVGTHLPAGLTALFKAARAPKELRRVRDLFTRLGTPLMRDIVAEASVLRATEAERAASAVREQAEREASAVREQAEREASAVREQAERAIATAVVNATRTLRAAAHAQREVERGHRVLAETRQMAECASRDAANARAAQANAEAHLAAVLGSTTWRAASRLHAILANKPRLRRFGRRGAKLVWWAVSLQLFARLAQRRSSAREAAALTQPSPDFSDGEHQLPAHLTPPMPDQITLRTHRIGPLATHTDASVDRPLIVYLSHVSPYPPRAGNEYRIQRVLIWLDSQGWDVVFLYCPLGGEEPDETRLAALVAGCDNLVYVHRDGHVRYSLARPDVEAVVASLDGSRTRDVAGLVRETSQPAVRLLGVMRTFCPDPLIEVMCAIDESFTPKILLASYVFMTRGLPLLRSGALKIVDTHDVFSTKSTKLTQFGIEDGLAMSEAEERHLLSQADLVMAIQPDEAEELRRIAPAARVLTVGVDMKVNISCSTLVEAPIVLLVASGNAMNAKGLRDFLRFAWPRVLQTVPGALLHVVGGVGKAVPGDEPGVLRLGQVDDLAEAYRAARIVINPTVAGTGLKIKTLEALAHLRPVVTWPSGLDGVSPELQELCKCATDWYAFSEALIHMLIDDDAARKVIAKCEYIAELLSPHIVFAELAEKLAMLQSRVAEGLRCAS